MKQTSCALSQTLDSPDVKDINTLAQEQFVKLSFCFYLLLIKHFFFYFMQYPNFLIFNKLSNSDMIMFNPKLNLTTLTFIQFTRGFTCKRNKIEIFSFKFSQLR